MRTRRFVRPMWRWTPDEIKRISAMSSIKLYKLIWQRFVASQMVPAVFDQTTVDIVAKC